MLDLLCSFLSSSPGAFFDYFHFRLLLWDWLIIFVGIDFSMPFRQDADAAADEFSSSYRRPFAPFSFSLHWFLLLLLLMLAEGWWMIFSRLSVISFSLRFVSFDYRNTCVTFHFLFSRFAPLLRCVVVCSRWLITFSSFSFFFDWPPASFPSSISADFAFRMVRGLLHFLDFLHFRSFLLRRFDFLGRWLRLHFDYFFHFVRVCWNIFVVFQPLRCNITPWEITLSSLFSFLLSIIFILWCRWLFSSRFSRFHRLIIFAEADAASASFSFIDVASRLSW